jgi:bifunctional non-homologous end joining protein LigD
MTNMDNLKITLNHHSVEITHPDKVLFPADGITKAEFVAYYQKIAPRMLPHLKQRPLAMERYQNGIGQEGFFQQNLPEYAPDWLDRVSVPKAGGSVTHLICNSTAALVYIANQDCITPHTWQSRLPDLEKPDRMIFDLDPTCSDFTLVKEGARFLRGLLGEIGLTAFLKTTGSRGLHVIVPLKPVESFDNVRALAGQIAAIMERREPAKYTFEHRIEKRGQRVYIDVLRNSYGHLAVAPYAVRARPGAPVAAPLNWEELEDRSLSPQKYNIRNIFHHLEASDPWHDLGRFNQSLVLPRRRLAKMQ